MLHPHTSVVPKQKLSKNRGEIASSKQLRSNTLLLKLKRNGDDLRLDKRTINPWMPFYFPTVVGLWLEFTVSCQIGFLLAHQLVLQQRRASTPANRGRTI